jgi:CspA family cold shock protein
MATGQVTRIMHDRSFGFIQPLRAGDEVLFYRSAVEDDAFDAVRVGQRVEFDLQADPRDPGRNRAIHVRMWALD